MKKNIFSFIVSIIFFYGFYKITIQIYYLNFKINDELHSSIGETLLLNGSIKNQCSKLLFPHD